MTNQEESFDQEIEIEPYSGITIFFIGVVAVIISLGFWFVIILGLFSIKDFVEYLINII
ncbi:hypothetical protein KLEP7_gp67 [Pseudaeromonas phage vB_PpeM_ KLEP7]|nr:hypothetical protein KLEP7_gp67 [Pseudaeromonas phage vB_PpeM_ KLEP7]